MALTNEEVVEGRLETVQRIKVECLHCCQTCLFFFFPLPFPIPKKLQVGRKFTIKVLIRSCCMKKVAVGGCLCEPQEIQAEIQAVWSLLQLLWLEYVHTNNKTG